MNKTRIYTQSIKEILSYQTMLGHIKNFTLNDLKHWSNMIEAKQVKLNKLN